MEKPIAGPKGLGEKNWQRHVADCGATGDGAGRERELVAHGVTVPHGTIFGRLRDGRRTLIWPLLSIDAPRTGEEFFSFRGVLTGLLLTASLTAAGNFCTTASA